MGVIGTGQFLKKDRVWIVKSGSGNIFKDGRTNLEFLDRFASAVSILSQKGIGFVLVISGIGIIADSLTQGQSLIRDHKLYIGERAWRNAIEESFFEYGFGVDIRLLVGEDLKHTAFLQELIQTRVGRKLLVFNGDNALNTGGLGYHKVCANNDLVGLELAKLAPAERLVIMTNTDGVYGKDGKTIRQIISMGQVRREIVFNGKSEYGTGGVETKVLAGLEFKRFGGKTSIIDGNNPNALIDVYNGVQTGTIIR